MVVVSISVVVVSDSDEVEDSVVVVELDEGVEILAEEVVKLKIVGGIVVSSVVVVSVSDVVVSHSSSDSVKVEVKGAEVLGLCVEKEVVKFGQTVVEFSGGIGKIGVVSSKYSLVSSSPSL